MGKLVFSSCSQFFCSPRSERNEAHLLAPPFVLFNLILLARHPCEFQFAGSCSSCPGSHFSILLSYSFQKLSSQAPTPTTKSRRSKPGNVDLIDSSSVFFLFFFFPHHPYLSLGSSGGEPQRVDVLHCATGSLALPCG